MKASRLVIPLFSLVIAVGCASSPPAPGIPAKEGVWPKIYSDETYLASFMSSWSPDEAIGAIRNLQNSMVISRRVSQSRT